MDYSKFSRYFDFDYALVNSDINYGFKIPFEKKTFLINHLKKLKDLTNDSKLFFPSFNYSFFKNKTYKVNDDKSEVGILSEFFRVKSSSWRSKVPVYSFSGEINLDMSEDSIIDPFDQKSFFNFLNSSNSCMIHYGSSFGTTTLIHYVERISNSLNYRYDKIFNGIVINENGLINEVSLKYHVRPYGSNLDYDWTKLEKDLIEENILKVFKQGKTKVMFFSVKELVCYWLQKLNEDSLYFLNQESKKWVLPKLEELGRKFIINDFELI
jgi:aminoglycoside N3'-acetyltransferase